MHFRFKSGPVTKEQVIGSLFKQTQDMFGSQADLDQLNQAGKVGWIEVDVKKKTVQLPLNTDKTTAVLIAATVESIQVVAGYDTQFTLQRIEDVWAELKEQVQTRAKQIIEQMNKKTEEHTAEAMMELEGFHRGEGPQDHAGAAQARRKQK